MMRASVTLRKPDDWLKWLFTRKMSADRNSLWEYVNPDLLPEKLKKLDDERPKELEVRRFRTPLPNEQIDIPDLTATELATYNAWSRRFDRDEAKWLTKQKALWSLSLEIVQTIDVKHLDLILSCADAHDQLKTLKKHLCPSTGERNHQLRAQYRAVCTRPKRANLDTWFDEWVTITRLLTEAKMPETTGNRAQEDFILSIRGLDDSWAASQLQDLIKKEQKDENFAPITDLIAEFRSYYRRTRPTASGLGTFATLEVAGSSKSQEALSGAQTGGKPQLGARTGPWVPKCIDGEKHTFENCPYVNQSVRIRGWKPDALIQEKFTELRSSPTNNRKANALRAVEQELRKHKIAEVKSASVISMDNGMAAGDMPHVNAVLQIAAATGVGKPPLLTRWILDPGSNCHVTNTRGTNWILTKKGGPSDCVYAGGVLAQVEEWGEMTIRVKTPTGEGQMKLTWVAYIPGFFTSVVGLSRSRSLGIHFDSGRDCLYQKKASNIVCLLQYRDGHWLVDVEEDQKAKPDLLSVYATRYTKPSKEPRKDLSVSQETAHRIFGHIGQKAVEHLNNHVLGINVEEQSIAPTWKDCEVCIETKLHRFVSRRAQSEPAVRPFYCIGMDLVQLRERNERCYNGDLWMLHAVCPYSKWHEATCLPDKSSGTLKRTVVRLLAKIERQYGAVVMIVRLDNERGYSELLHVLRDLGIVVEFRAEYTEEQNGLSEQAGKMIVVQGRAIRIDGRLPMELSNECCLVAVYLLNRTPVESLGWKTPYEVVRGQKPSAAHLNVVGARAYVLNNKLKHGEKLESRALIRQLVGYDSTNIYRVWMPALGRVLRTRDVVFMTNDRTEPVYPDRQTLREVVTILDVPEPPEETDQEIELLLQSSQKDWSGPSQSEQAAQTTQDKEMSGALPTPESTPELITQPEPEPELEPKPDAVEMPRGWEPVPAEAEAPDRRSNNAPRREEISSQLSESNVLTGKRQRQKKTLGTYFVAFAAALQPPESQKSRLHRDQLPPPPKRWEDLEKHPFGQEFKAAAAEEFNSCEEKGCFKTTSVTEADSHGHSQRLPLMWVFTYKFDEDGLLYKYKARLVVRGDLQEDWGNTYAATLAARVFRFLMALAAAFGLRAYQYDVLNAFLNAPLDKLVYIQTPDPYVEEHGKLLELQRALYGLKDAPLLWYKHLKETLIKLGLRPVKDVPCLFTNKRLIVFFYVDNIVVLVHPNHLDNHQQFERQLEAVYDLRKLGELKWFLGIRVLRDWTAGTLWLIQDSFIEKVVNKFDLDQKSGGRYPAVPLVENSLAHSTEDPNHQRTQLYQQLVGSLAYISTFTRPDVARAHSVLARHLQNPGQKHLSAVYHVWRYLYGTKHLAIRASQQIAESSSYVWDKSLFYGASDAAFADDAESRRSSHGYLFKLYGMPIDWKATQQKSVTKSTTEAELIALSATGGEMEWWTRVFQHIKFDPEIQPTIYCNNEQKVGIVKKEDKRLNTKLRHVDTHQMWVRQEVQEGRLYVEWCPTAEMPADGLTKSLVRQKHAEFMRQLGLENVRQLLTSQVNTPEPAELRHWY